MSNPYAPPGDRPRQPGGDRAGAPGPGPDQPAQPGQQAQPGQPPHPAQPPQPAPAQHPGYPPNPYPHAQWPPQAMGAPRPTEPVPTDPDGEARAGRLARLFGVLVLSSVLVSTTRVPLRAVALVFIVAAVVVGVWALVVAGRAHVRGTLPVLIGVGLSVALVWALLMGTALLFWGPERARQECRDGALTISAQAACEAQYQKDINELSTRLQRKG